MVTQTHKITQTKERKLQSPRGDLPKLPEIVIGGAELPTTQPNFGTKTVEDKTN